LSEVIGAIDSGEGLRIIQAPGDERVEGGRS